MSELYSKLIQSDSEPLTTALVQIVTSLRVCDAPSSPLDFAHVGFSCRALSCVVYLPKILLGLQNLAHKSPPLKSLFHLLQKELFLTDFTIENLLL